MSLNYIVYSIISKRGEKHLEANHYYIYILKEEDAAICDNQRQISKCVKIIVIEE